VLRRFFLGRNAAEVNDAADPCFDGSVAKRRSAAGFTFWVVFRVSDGMDEVYGCLTTLESRADGSLVFDVDVYPSLGERPLAITRTSNDAPVGRGERRIEVTSNETGRPRHEDTSAVIGRHRRGT
jgi:hypothetical protein